MRDPRDTYPSLDAIDYAEEFTSAYWVVPGVAVFICKTCGAWVDPMSTTRHVLWHGSLATTVFLRKVEE